MCSIALEIPNTALATTAVGIWHRTLDGTSGTWVQADPGARPSQSIFLTGEQKDAYLAGDPAEDSKFVAVFAHSLEHTGGYSTQEARRVAGTLLPDILPFEPGQPASYLTNGRTLSDDVMDVFISILTNGKQTGDGVDAHHDLLAEFPYLGPPHQVRQPLLESAEALSADRLKPVTSEL